MDAVAIAPLRGFDDPVHDAQGTFRTIMDAMAQPGSEHVLAVPAAVPEPMHPAAAAIMLTLFDYDTPVHLEPVLHERPEVQEFIAFNTGAPVTVQTEKAAFAIAGHDGGLPDPGLFALGTAEYPDRSTTQILALPQEGQGCEVALSGPGIESSRNVTLPGVGAEYWRALIANRAGYPLGVDVVFTRGTRIVCLPRSTRIRIIEEA